MKLAINRKPISGPWGGGNNFVKAVYATVPSGVTITNSLSEDIDAVFLMDPRKENGMFDANEVYRFTSSVKKIPVIQRINECDARKGTEHMDNLLLQCSILNTKTIFVSNWMKDYFNKKGWNCKQQEVLHNGVDDSFIENRKTCGYDISNNKKLKVVTHHWSNNSLKGFDVYEFIDYLTTKEKNIEFTYIGRERGTFRNTRIVPPIHGEELAKELAKHDVYISGSRHDPGPNHILESIAVGLPTYVHVEGGGSVEFAGLEHAYKNFFEIEKLLLNKDFKNNSYNILRWSDSMKSFWNIISQ
jgi:hypothetical protein